MIKMYYNDHNPPHFHAQYGSDQMVVDVNTLGVIGGRLAPLPDGSELASLREGLEAFRTMYREDAALALELTSDVESISEVERIEIATYTMVINALFNLDAVKTRE